MRRDDEPGRAYMRASAQDVPAGLSAKQEAKRKVCGLVAMKNPGTSFSGQSVKRALARLSR